jgi:predicted GNAT family acetyltransferase
MNPGARLPLSQTTHVDKQLTGTAGRYVAIIDGVDGEAEITFTVRGPALISADHTGAPDSMRGTGVAAKLVDHMIADARSNGFMIIPICPYVKAQYKKHPEWRDVMTVEA